MALASTLAAAALPAGQEAADAAAAVEPPGLAVLRLDNPTGNLWWTEVGLRRAQDLLVEALRSGAGDRYRVLDRETFDARVQEEGLLLPAGRLSPAGAVKIGRVLGVRYVVTGSVSEYGAGPKDGRRRVFGLLSGRDFVAEISLRVLDARNGRLLWTSNDRAAEKPAEEWVRASETEADALLYERLAVPMLEALGAALAQAQLEPRAPE